MGEWSSGGASQAENPPWPLGSSHGPSAHAHLQHATGRLYPRPAAAWPQASPKAEISHLSKRWRAERNLWISAFAFTAWV